jgi:WD40 repeat protein
MVMNNKILILILLHFVYAQGAAQESNRALGAREKRPAVSLLSEALSVIDLQYKILDYLNIWEGEKTLNGHESRVMSVTISPNGNYLISGSNDNIIKIWRKDKANKWLCIQTLADHAAFVCTEAFSPDGNFLGTRDINNQQISLKNFDIKPNEKRTGSITALVFAPDEHCFASASTDKTIKVWKQINHAWVCVQSLEDQYAVLSLAFSPDGQYLASGSSNIKIWQQDNNKQWSCVQTLRDPNVIDHIGSYPVISIAFSQKGEYLASAFANNCINMWQLDSNNKWACVQAFQPRRAIKKITFSLDGVFILAFCNNTLEILSQAIDKSWRIIEFYDDPAGLINAIAFSSDGKYLAFSPCNMTIKIWRNQQLEILNHTKKPNLVKLPLKDLVLSYLNLQKWKCAQTEYHKDFVTTLAFSPDGKHLASGFSPHYYNSPGSIVSSFKLWEHENDILKCINETNAQEICAHKFLSINSVAFSPYGKLVIGLTTGINQGKLMIYHQNRWLHISDLGAVYAVAFSPDEKYIASVSNNIIKIWQLNNIGEWICIQNLTEHAATIRSINFSLDGQFLASGSFDNTIKIWKQINHTWVCVQTLEEHKDLVNSVNFSSDSQFLASASNDNTIKIWEQNNNKWMCVQTLLGHEYRIKSVAFSPDSKFLASGSCDNTIKIWKQHNNKWICAQTLLGHVNAIHSVTFSPDSKFLASGSEDGTIKIWGNQQLEILDHAQSYLDKKNDHE